MSKKDLEKSKQILESLKTKYNLSQEEMKAISDGMKGIDKLIFAEDMRKDGWCGGWSRSWD